MIVSREAKDVLPESVAPQKESTLERRGVNIPANPIYDLDTTIDNYVLPEKKHHIISGYNGGDEDEILDQVINEFAEVSKDSYGNKTGQKVLSKKNARRSAEVALEAAHKLTAAQVPDWVNKHFETSWNHFDQNKEGWLRYEECHTFFRHMFGVLNKFNVAPGSISDVTTGGASYKLHPDVEKTPVGNH